MWQAFEHLYSGLDYQRRESRQALEPRYLSGIPALGLTRLRLLVLGAAGILAIGMMKRYWPS